jgi:Zinc finger, C2H2 type
LISSYFADLEEHQLSHTDQPVDKQPKMVIRTQTAPRTKAKNEIVIDSRFRNQDDDDILNEKKPKVEKVVSKEHFCCKCKNTYDEEAELIQHFNEVHPDKVRFQYDDVFSRSEDQVQCSLCLSYVKDIYRHRRNKHDRSTYVPKRDFQCTDCGKVYRTDRALKECERKHKGLPLERLQCPQCPVTLANRMNLIGHMKLHSKLFRYECELCGRQFRKGTNLKKHLMSTHSDERNFSCDVCGKSMKTKSSLSMHMRIHTGNCELFSYCSFSG